MERSALEPDKLPTVPQEVEIAGTVDWLRDGKPTNPIQWMFYLEISDAFGTPSR